MSSSTLPFSHSENRPCSVCNSYVCRCTAGPTFLSSGAGPFVAPEAVEGTHAAPLDYARGEKVTVTFSGTWEAAPEHFFSDDDFPRRVTAADLAKAMREYAGGDRMTLLREWCLLDCIEIQVEDERV